MKFVAITLLLVAGLVGTAQQVAESLLDYHEVGIDAFLVRGFDPLPDSVQYGRELIPLTRALAAERLEKRLAERAALQASAAAHNTLATL